MNVELRVDLPAPLDIGGSLALFKRSGDDLIDRWDGQRLVRAVPVGETWVPFVATAGGSLAAPSFDVLLDDSTHVERVRQTAATTFTALPDDYARLLHEDPVIARLNKRYPGIRQIRQLDLFTALVRCISAQQVNLRWAVTTRRRLAEAFGQRHEVGDNVVYSLDPRRIAGVDPAEIRALQFTTSKSVSIVAVAQTLVAEGLSSERLSPLPDQEIIDTLVRIKGIGRWSAEWVLARTLGRACVVAGDLGVRKAVGLAYLASSLPFEPEVRSATVHLAASLPSEAEVRAATAHWGDSAGVAQALLLHALGEGALSPPTPGGSPVASRR